MGCGATASSATYGTASSQQQEVADPTTLTGHSPPSSTASPCSTLKKSCHPPSCTSPSAKKSPFNASDLMPPETRSHVAFRASEVVRRFDASAASEVQYPPTSEEFTEKRQPLPEKVLALEEKRPRRPNGQRVTNALLEFEVRPGVANFVGSVFDDGPEAGTLSVAELWQLVEFTSLPPSIENEVLYALMRELLLNPDLIQRLTSMQKRKLMALQRQEDLHRVTSAAVEVPPPQMKC